MRKLGQRPESMQAKTKEFKAHPVPRAILERPVGIPPKAQASSTVPHTPRIRQAKKLRESGLETLETPKCSPFVARPAPSFDSPFRPHLEHKHTLPRTVHLPGEKISEAKRQRFLQKVDEELEARRKEREFQASQYKPTDFVSKPVTPRPLTVPRPFKLTTDVRGASYQERFHHAIQGDVLREKENRQFHAQPVHMTSPFVPAKSAKTLTVPLEPHLNTEGRLEAWKAFSDTLNDKEAEQEHKRRRQMEAEKVGLCARCTLTFPC